MKILDDLYAFLWRDPSANNCNTYLIDGPQKVLVDPGHAHLFGHIRDKLASISLAVEDIDLVIITHAHPDHMEGVSIFADTRALVAIHALETAFNREMASQYGDAIGSAGFEPDVLLREGDLRIGDMVLRVLDTPGHSPGSLCLYRPGDRVLFSGDVVFNQGVGRTDLPGGNGEQLKRSIRMLSELDADILLPGHGEIVTGRDRVRANFADIERAWFPYL